MESATIAQCVEILRCPVTSQALSMLSPVEIADSNGRLAAGALVHRDGSTPRAPLTFALGTPGRKEIYRVEDSIAWLLPDLALVGADAVQAAAITAERKVVQSFYDEYGWVKADDGFFNDTARFTDTRSVARDYQRYCNERIGRELAGGRFLLDVASGAIPHAEYLEFSRHYDVRICVDFSIRALREARRKLGEGGLYILGDITRLPLASDAIDTVISLHTVYHVPRTEQTAAINELVRVTKRGGRVVVAYVWATSALMDAAFNVRRELGRLRRMLRSKKKLVSAGPSNAPPIPELYFSPQNFDWFSREIAATHATRLRVWSAVSMNFQTHFFSDRRLGRIILALTKRLEDWFPRWAGRYGQYPLFILEKPSR